MIDKELLEILACPQCKEPVRLEGEKLELAVFLPGKGTGRGHARLDGQAGRQQFNDFLEKSELSFARAGMFTVVHRSHESCCFSAPLQ